MAVVNLKRKMLANLSLSDHCKQVILGSLLGDGCLVLSSGYKNPRFLFRHSEKQKLYFEWKLALLEEISSDGSYQVQAPDGWSTRNKLLYQSRALQDLLTIYKIVYLNGRKLVQRRWLNHLSPLALAVWWLDDGSIIGSGRKGVLCTDGFSFEEVEILARYLDVVWGLNVRVGRIRKDSNKECYRIWFNTLQLKKFLLLIMPYVKVSSMLYKFFIVYNDESLQERWISEMLQKMPDFREEIISLANSKSKKFVSRQNGCKVSENDIVREMTPVVHAVNDEG